MMLGAGLYIMVCSARNRLVRRIRRLREPRYLFGAIVGIAYFYFAIFRTGRRPGDASQRERAVARAAPAAISFLGPAAPALAGLLLLLVAAASWVYPVGSGLLNFSQAEKQFLFTAPVPRRQLLVYRLMRTQVAVLLSAIVLAVLYPAGSSGDRVRAAAAIWIFLMASHLYFAGVTLSRRRVPAEESSRWILRTPFIFTISATAVVGAALVRTLIDRPVTDLADAWATLGTIVQTGLAQAALLPFTAILGPLFAKTAGEWARSLPAALIVLAVAVAWVLRIGEGLDAGVEVVPEERATPARRTPTYRGRAVGWKLRPAGPPEVALVWKGVAQTLRVVDWRLLVRGGGIILWLVAASIATNRAKGLAELLGVLSVFAMGFTVAMGPQVLRADLRQDLQHLELLKTWPIRSGALVRGELLWPALLLTGVAWTFGALALAFSANAFSSADSRWRLAVGTAVMILTPALVGAQFTIHNLAALLFPAWIQLGAGRARGVDAIGQRLILLGGTWLMLAVLLVPGVVVGGIVGLVLYWTAGPWALIPAALACFATVAVELFVATEALGPLYDRLDLTSVERAE